MAARLASLSLMEATKVIFVFRPEINEHFFTSSSSMLVSLFAIQNVFYPYAHLLMGMIVCEETNTNVHMETRDSLLPQVQCL